MDEQEPQAPSGISGTKVVAAILIAIALMLSAAFFLWFRAKDEYKKQQRPTISTPR